MSRRYRILYTTYTFRHAAFFHSFTHFKVGIGYRSLEWSFEPLSMKRGLECDQTGPYITIIRAAIDFFRSRLIGLPVLYSPMENWLPWRKAVGICDAEYRNKVGTLVIETVLHRLY